MINYELYNAHIKLKNIKNVYLDSTIRDPSQK